MSWYGWLSLAGSLAPMPWIWRLAFRGTVKSMTYGSADWLDVSFAAIIGVFAMCVWPLVLLCLVLKMGLHFTSADDFAARVGGSTREDKLKRREREVANREQRIRDLEREMEIA